MSSNIVRILLFTVFGATVLAGTLYEVNDKVEAHLEPTCKTLTRSEHCVPLGKKFYLIDPNHKLNWFQADRYCRQQNARLAVIENDGEMDAMADYLDKFHSQGWYAFWLSATKLGTPETEKTFYDFDSGLPITYTRWGINLPDSYKGREDCLNLIWLPPNTRYIMNDDNCNYDLHFICEFKENSKKINFSGNLNITLDQKNECSNSSRW